MQVHRSTHYGIIPYDVTDSTQKLRFGVLEALYTHGAMDVEPQSIDGPLTH